MVDEQFRSLIEQEIEVLEELIQLSLSKKEALLRNDLDSLEKISLDEERLAIKFKKIDDACAPQVQFFLNAKKHTDVTDDIKERLTRLRKTALQLKINNQFNQDVLQDAIGFTKFTLNMLTGAFKETSYTYNPAGKVVNGLNNPNKSHLLDFKG